MILIGKNGERYYTLRACSKELGISHQMVAELIRAGKMRRDKITTTIERIPESEVLKFKKIYERA